MYSAHTRLHNKAPARCSPPQNWLETSDGAVAEFVVYDDQGDEVSFFVVKAPLPSHYVVPESKVFGCADAIALARQRCSGRVPVAFINLSDISDLYSDEFAKNDEFGSKSPYADIDFVHSMTIPTGFENGNLKSRPPPDDLAFLRFVSQVKEICKKHGTMKGKVIILHCTHGHNRTGMMLVRYAATFGCLLDRDLQRRASLGELLDHFARCRTPEECGIYDWDTVRCLYHAYNMYPPAQVAGAPIHAIPHKRKERAEILERIGKWCNVGRACERSRIPCPQASDFMYSTAMNTYEHVLAR